MKRTFAVAWIVVGCSSAPAREPRPPLPPVGEAPADASVAVAETPADAASAVHTAPPAPPPPVAPVPCNPQNPVPCPPSGTQLHGDIIAIEKDQDGADITIDLGTADGVSTSWTGTVGDPHATFVVSKVTKRSCFAKVKVSLVALKHGSLDVTLHSP